MFWLCYGEYRGKRELKRFIEYVKAKIDAEYGSLVYRIYVTDLLKGIHRGLGGEVSMRYYDMVFKSGKEERRTADEIVSGIRNKLNRFTEV